MSILRRREISVMILALIVVVGLADYFTIIPTVKTAARTLTAWVSVMAALAVGIGAINIAILHGRKIIRRTPGQWIYSIILISMIILTVIMGLGFPGGVSSPVYQLWYNTFFVPSDTMIFALIGWFLVPAAYRAFRIRSFEAFILLISCVIVMLTNVPIGEVIWSGLPVIGKWILETPNVAGQRAFIIVVAIGMIILCLRTMLGYERGALGGEGV